MSGGLAAVVVLRAAVAKRGTAAGKTKAASAAAGLGNARTAHSSIDDGESRKDCKENRSHDAELCIKDYS